MHACALWAHCRFRVSWSFLGGQLWWLGVCCLCAAGHPCNVMLGVVPAWDRVFWFCFIGGRVGVMGCLW